MNIAKVVNHKSINGVVTGFSSIASVSVQVETGNFKSRIVSLVKGEMALFAGQTATMEEIKKTIDAAYVDQNETPKKGTEYRKIVYCACKESGLIVDTLKGEMESGSTVGKFLKRLSDFIRNNYEIKPEKTAEAEKTADQIAEELTKKRIDGIEKLRLLFAGDDNAIELLADLEKIA